MNSWCHVSFRNTDCNDNLDVFDFMTVNKLFRDLKKCNQIFSTCPIFNLDKWKSPRAIRISKMPKQTDRFCSLLRVIQDRLWIMDVIIVMFTVPLMNTLDGHRFQLRHPLFYILTFGSYLSDWRNGLKTRKYGAASAPIEQHHCTPPELDEGS